MAHRLAFFLLSSLAGLVLLGGCNGQGEGDVCDMRAGNNGTDDCQNGLTCFPPMAPFNYPRCCPSDTTLASVPACRPGSSGLGDAQTAAPDASELDATVSSDASAGSTGDASVASDDGAAE
jgi:hypothetical protein